MPVRALTDHADRVPAGRIHALLDTSPAGDTLAVEARYLRDDPGFERPYGWAWAVTLAAWCHTCPDPAAATWATALEPLTAVVEDLVLA